MTDFEEEVSYSDEDADMSIPSPSAQTVEDAQVSTPVKSGASQDVSGQNSLRDEPLTAYGHHRAKETSGHRPYASRTHARFAQRGERAKAHLAIAG